MRGSSLLADWPGASSASEISGNASLREVLAQQETTNKPAEARDDHRNNHPHADDRGAKEGTHTIRVVLAHLGRDIRVVGVGSKENRSKRANPPQGKQQCFEGH